jgi:hypothetical protein
MKVEWWDQFEVEVAGASYLFDFGRAESGTFIATNGELKFTVEGDTLAECREVAREAVILLLEDVREVEA